MRGLAAGLLVSVVAAANLTAATVPVSISVFSTGMTVEPAEVSLCSGERIEWRSSATLFVPPPAIVEVSVPAGPFGAVFQSQAPVFANITSPPAVDAAAGTTTPYSIRVFDEEGRVIRRNDSLEIKVVASFDQIAEDVQNRLNDIPENVDISDVLDSVGPGGFEKDFACPENTPDSSVKLRVTTEVLPGGANLTGGDTYGLYRTGKPTSREIVDENNDTIKLVEFENALLLDCARFHSYEPTTAGQIHNEVIYYHELLHGQLFIDRALAEIESQLLDLCRSQDLEATEQLDGDLDQEHAMIDPLEDEYAKSQQSRGAVYRRLELTRQQRLVIEEIQLNKDIKVGGRLACWGTSNVKSIVTDARADTDRVFIKVEVEGQEPAIVKCLIDPPDVLTAIVITFGEGLDVPTLSQWSLVMLGALLLVSGLFVMARRRSLTG